MRATVTCNLKERCAMTGEAEQTAKGRNSRGKGNTKGDWAMSERQAATLRPADRAGGKLSLRARVKAFSMTRLQVASDRWGARLPSRMVVLALIGGSSSTYSAAQTALCKA